MNRTNCKAPRSLRLARAAMLLVAALVAHLTARAESMTATPLTLEAASSGQISFTLNLGYGVDQSVMTPIEYRKNSGEWTTYTWNEPIAVVAGDKVAFRGDNAKYFGNGSPSFDSHITSTADVYVYGNIMSLLSSSGFASLTSLTAPDTFSHLFALPGANPWQVEPNTTIKSHPTLPLVLPATELTNMCYQYMFAGCQGLTRAPELPATEMTVACYASMFQDCTGLTQAPAILPCTAMTPYSIDDSDPSHLVERGSIDCYMEMFRGCTALTVAPELPATQLVHGAYQYMFAGCTSLLKAPVLPAPKVADYAYTSMFEGCTSLNYVKCLATEFLIDPEVGNTEEDDVKDWLKGVSPTGTFVKADEMTSWAAGDSGIPEGWTLMNAGDEGDDFADAEAPLTFEAVALGSVTVYLDEGAVLDPIRYRLNDGLWTEATWGEPIAVNAGDKVSFSGDNGACYDEEHWAGFHFESAADCYVYGNLMSLIDSENFATVTTLTKNYTFFHLFQNSDYSPCVTIKNHPTRDIVLPATTLTDNCYDGLFADCHGITRAPELPATDLAEWCYCMMFSGTSITEAPELPATVLANACYSDMFMNCTSLTAAPVLPAPTLVEGCYSSMFTGCSELNYVKCLATDISADYCTIGWLSDVAETGTFIKAAGMNDWTVGPDEYDNVNGIPEGWTVAESESTSVQSIDIAAKPHSRRYNLMGQPVGSDYKGIVIEDGKKIIVK